MSDRPNKGELLAAAEETLRDEVLPALEGSASAGRCVRRAAATASSHGLDGCGVSARRTA